MHARMQQFKAQGATLKARGRGGAGNLKLRRDNTGEAGQVGIKRQSQAAENLCLPP